VLAVVPGGAFDEPGAAALLVALPDVGRDELGVAVTMRYAAIIRST